MLKLPLYCTRSVWRQLRYDFYTLRTTSQAKNWCMLAGQLWVLSVMCTLLRKCLSELLRHAAKCSVTSHHPSASLLGAVQASNVGEQKSADCYRFVSHMIAVSRWRRSINMFSGCCVCCSSFVGWGCTPGETVARQDAQASRPAAGGSWG